MKKISLLCYNILTTGGTEKVVMAIANELANRNMDVEVVYMRKGNNDMPKDIAGNIKFKQLKSEKASRCIREIRTYIKKTEPEAIISFGRHINTILMLAKIGTKTKTKFILTEHGNPNMAQKLEKNKVKKLKVQITNQLANKLYKHSDHVVAVSYSLRNILKENISNVEVIYNPAIDRNLKIKAREQINEYPYTQNQIPIIVTVGRLVEIKNHELLIEAFEKVLEETQAYLVIIGDGELEDHLKDKLEKSNLTDKVFMMGYKENPYPYIRNASVFALSSKTEAFGIVLVESLALGTPVVSTDCEVGPREILKDGEFGTLCGQNIEELSKGIIHELKNSKLNRDTKEELEEYLKQFDVEQIVSQYLELIKD